MEISQADAQAHAQLWDLRVAVIAEGLAHAFHDLGGLFQGHLRKNHTEFIPSIPAREVVFPQVAPQLQAQLPKDRVTDNMAVGVIDLLEMVDVDQGDRGVALLLLALVELEVQQVFPRAVVKQAGEAVDAAQGTERAFMFGQFDCQLIADHANGHGVERQHRQAGIDLNQTDRRVELQAEHHCTHGGAQHLGQCATYQQAFATGGDVIHGDHRQQGHGGQRRELQRGGPEPTEHSVIHQVALFGVVGEFGTGCQLIRKVRPDETVDQQ